jgi:uncharacterized membrane protein
VTIWWMHAGPSIFAAFLASLVEFVEALTIVLAVGSIRGWRGALTGSAAAVAVLFAIASGLGPALARVPLDGVRAAVGLLSLLFGLRWLRKACLREAGIIPQRDKQGAFAKEVGRMQGLGAAGGWDKIAIASSFQITMLEGLEVVFIVLAVGSEGSELLLPAAAGALVALLLVVSLGFALHRPLANIPENALKFVVGVLLSAFGTFWTGEGLHIIWPGGDWAILGLVIGFLMAAALTIRICRRALASAD